MSDPDARPQVHVVAGALTDPAGRVLIAQRPPGKHMAGFWEFPGGKVEPGEERRSALARELREELGVDIVRTALRPLTRVRHAYAARDVLIDMWVVKQFTGEPRGLEGQALRWCTLEELGSVELLPADAPIVAALWLPERITQMSSAHFRIASFTPRSTRPAPLRTNRIDLHGALCASAADALGAAAAGADFLAMRTALAAGELAALCDLAGVPVFARDIGLEQAWELGASGLNEIRA